VKTLILRMKMAGSSLVRLLEFESEFLGGPNTLAAWVAFRYETPQ
jgi:hypothetical protein